MSKSLAIAYAMKRKAKKMAKGGSVEEGPSEKENQMGVHKIVPNYDKAHHEVKHGQSEARYGNKKQKHAEVIAELRSMPKPDIKGLAHGGEVEDDMVDQIMKKRGCYSEGGMVANDDEPEADEMSASYDDLANRDELEFHDTGANSGDELDNRQEDHDRSDVVEMIMKSRKKRDRLPSPL